VVEQRPIAVRQQLLWLTETAGPTGSQYQSRDALVHL